MKYHQYGEMSSKSIDLSQLDWLHGECESVVKFNKERNFDGVRIKIRI